MGILTNIRKQAKQFQAPKPTKAVSDYLPDLRYRVHESGGAAQSEPAIDTFVGAAAVYDVHTWVRKAVSMTAENIAPLPVRVVDENDEAIDNHPLTMFLNAGNDTMSPAQVWEAYTISMLLGGESPLEIVPDKRGNPLWLWPRRPDRVLVHPDMAPERRLYPTVAEYTVMPDKDGDAVRIPPDSMIFDKFHNPVNPWRGISPIAAVRNSIIIDVYAQAWSKKFLQSGARPDYALIAPQGITQTERERLEATLLSKYGGPDGWHKPVILEDGITDIKTFSFAPKDIEWLQQREFSRDEIAALFGVPDELMGFGKNTYENFQTALTVFWTLTLQKFVTRRDATLTHFFMVRRPMLQPGQRIATDLSGIGVLQEDKAPKVAMAKTLWDMGAPFNQLDEQLRLGVGPVPNGEMPYGKPLEVENLIVDDNGETVKAREIFGYHIEQGVVTRNEARVYLGLPTQDDSGERALRDLRSKLDVMQEAIAAGLTAQAAADLVGLDVSIEVQEEPSETPAESPRNRPANDAPDDDMPDDDEDDNMDAADKGAATAHGFFTREVAQITPSTVKALLLQLDPDDDEAERTVRMALERRSKRKIRDALQELLDTLYPNDWNYEWANAEQEAIRVHNQFVRDQQLRDAVSRALQDGVDLGVSVAVNQLETIGFGFDWTLPNIAARDWALAHTDDILRDMADVTERGVGQALSRWIGNGESLEALKNDLEPLFGASRASRIAVTEVTRAYAEGSTQAYQASGVVLWREWRTAADERVCPVCGALHGKRRKFGESFDDGIDNPPAHVNCRCFVAPVVD